MNCCGLIVDHYKQLYKYIRFVHILVISSIDHYMKRVLGGESNNRSETQLWKNKSSREDKNI